MQPTLEDGSEWQFSDSIIKELINWKTVNERENEKEGNSQVVSLAARARKESAIVLSIQSNRARFV